MKNKPVLSKYKEWMEKRELPEAGLCVSLNDQSAKVMDLFDLLHPTDEDLFELARREKSSLFWASGMSVHSQDREKYYKLTPLRQTILLLLAALNNEL